MTRRETLKTLLQEALHVGALLNSIPDIDEREAAREQFVDVLNDELFHGARSTRELMAEAHGFSLRVAPMNKVQSLAEYDEWKRSVQA